MTDSLIWGQWSIFFKFLKLFGFAIFDGVHDVEAIDDLCKLLIAYRNLF